jgi:hypothetical protein
MGIVNVNVNVHVNMNVNVNVNVNAKGAISLHFGSISALCFCESFVNRLLIVLLIVC